MLKNIFLILFALLVTDELSAGRPLYTDDANVVGAKAFQIETWAFSDKRSLQHWIVPTYGVSKKIEISAAGVHGLALIKEQRNQYTYSGPILQGKIKLSEIKEDGTPGFGFSGGSIMSYGSGYFKTANTDLFYYLAASSFILGTDKILVHANLGQQTRRAVKKQSPIVLWGAACEVKTGSRTYSFIEASNGEVTALNPGISSQLGFRHDIDAQLQIDGTVGTGLSGNPRLPFWMTVGIRKLFGL